MDPKFASRLMLPFPSMKGITQDAKKGLDHVKDKIEFEHLLHDTILNLLHTQIYSWNRIRS